MQAITGVIFLFAGIFAKAGFNVSLRNYGERTGKIHWGKSGLFSPVIAHRNTASRSFLQPEKLTRSADASAILSAPYAGGWDVGIRGRTSFYSFFIPVAGNVSGNKTQQKKPDSYGPEH